MLPIFDPIRPSLLFSASAQKEDGGELSGSTGEGASHGGTGGGVLRRVRPPRVARHRRRRRRVRRRGGIVPPGGALVVSPARASARGGHRWGRARDDGRRPEVATSVAAASRALRDAARRGRSRRVRPSPRRPRPDVLPNRAHRRRRRARVLRVPRFFSAGAVADARGCAGAAQRVRADVRRARIARPDHRRPATRPQRRRGAVRVRHAGALRRPARRNHRRGSRRRPQRRVVVSLVERASRDRRTDRSGRVSRVGTHSAPRWAPAWRAPAWRAPRAHDAILRVR